MGMSVSQAGATVFTYADFSSTAGLTLNVNAAQAGNELRVVPSLQVQVGSVFYTAPVDVTSFSTSFTFRITSPLNGGADGLAFIVQGAGANAIGAGGGGLGYEGLTNGVAVEFDTWNNGLPYDPSDNHVGIDTGGSVVSNVTANIAPSFENGAIWYAWVNYNGSQLDLFLNTSATKPGAATLSYLVDIPAMTGGANAWVGFSGGTGFAAEDTDVLSWTFADHASVPEPATLGLMGLGLLAVSVLRKR